MPISNPPPDANSYFVTTSAPAPTITIPACFHELVVVQDDGKVLINWERIRACASSPKSPDGRQEHAWAEALVAARDHKDLPLKGTGHD